VAGNWIAERTEHFDSSGIRKVFDLAAKMKDPINLSIGQPDFAVPQPIQDAAIAAIRENKNGYSPTQGMQALRERLAADMQKKYRDPERDVFVTSGTSGGLVLAMLAMVNPGDEVIIFDPYFVMYKSLIGLVGGIPVIIDTYPDFHIDLNMLRGAITPRTKAILVNSPANPTGVVASAETLRGVAELAAEHDVALISDEIYSLFCYDAPFASPAKHNPNTLVIDGFSKTYGLTGWRVGYAHGPKEIISQMIKIQQYTFVCSPQPLQWGALSALDVSMEKQVSDYRRKRDLIVAGLKDLYELETPGGAFYAYPKVPKGTATDFVTKAIENQLLIIPGNIFSRRDTHFRISYAAADKTLERGIEVLRKLAKG
jgi:aspartate aminotransferase/aminotransferase